MRVLIHRPAQHLLIITSSLRSFSLSKWSPSVAAAPNEIRPALLHVSISSSPFFFCSWVGEGVDGANHDGAAGVISHCSTHRCFFNTVPSFPERDMEMRGLLFFPSILLPLPLACESLDFSLHFQQSLCVVLLSATRGVALSPAHKGHSLHIFCFSNYKIHEKLKQQWRRATKPPEQDSRSVKQDRGDSNLLRFIAFIRERASAYGGRKRGCSAVCG